MRHRFLSTDFWFHHALGNGTTEERRGLKRRMVSLVLDTDTTATRMTLVIYAVVVSFAFWIDQGNCELRLCEILDMMFFMFPFGGWKAWGLAWTVYAILGLWRILDGHQRPRIALVFHFIGAFMFGAVAAAAIIARWPAHLVSAPYLALAGAAIWVAMRTAINPGRGFRGD